MTDMIPYLVENFHHPSALTLRGLMTRVIDYGFDIGIATDGSAGQNWSY